MKSTLNEHTVFRATVILTGIGSIALVGVSTAAALGLFLGGMISLLSFRLLIVDVDKLLKMPVENLKPKVWRGYLGRYVLSGAALAVSLTNPGISFVTTLLGLIVPKLIIVVLAVVRR